MDGLSSIWDDVRRLVQHLDIKIYLLPLKDMFKLLDIQSSIGVIVNMYSIRF